MNSKVLSTISTLALAIGVFAMPIAASAQGSINREIDRRNQTRDEWKTIATISGAAALLGVLNKDSTLTFAGSAGALYSLYRYDQDSRSKSRLERMRAEYFSRDHFYRDGVRYDRRTVTKSGKKYYQFVKQKGWEKIGHHDNASDNGQWHREHGGNGNGHGKGKGKGHGHD